MLSRRISPLIAGLLFGIYPADSQPASPPSRAAVPVLLTSPAPVPKTPPPQVPPREIPIHRPPVRPGSGNVADPVVQGSTPTPSAAASLGQWEGQGAGYPGFTVAAIPPDTNMAVGPNHIVQWVNNSMVIFNKQGGVVQAPVADSTFWSSLNGTCYQGGGMSDPVVLYDRVADRWIVGEVAIPLLPGFLGQYAQCFAVSKTSDPTFISDGSGNNSSYYIWAYGFGANINDYDKMAVWSDGYYVTWNIFQNGATFSGPEACAWSRTDMINGAASPKFVCFQLSTAYSSLLASNLDGATAPPAGSPNFVMDVDTASGALHLWKFHADFVNTANSTFTGPTVISGVAPFTAPCPSTQDCIPQPGTTQALDALADRLMYRLAYRNFGDHESIVANHTVQTAAGNTGVRWYEVRNPNSVPAIYQQGTFAPDSDNRWMASIGMDKSGNIGVGYSVASGVTYPSIRYTGWEVGNPLGTLQAETTLVGGGGSQTGYNRWGDYSLMTADPSDDCTFWYTQEYQATTQAGNWNTRIGSFKFPSCGQAQISTTTTLVSSANPSNYGQPVAFTATVTPAAGTVTPTGSVTFKDGSTTLGSQTLDGSGVASFSISTLAGGVHSITAVYGGTSTFSGSTSAAVNETVNPAVTSTTVTSSLNPSTYGASVQFTASVTPSTATGTVQFLDGATSLGSVSLNGGTASLSTSSLTGGSHTITAKYLGSTNYSASTSGGLSQTVNPASTTTTLTSTPNPSGLGQNVTFTATVSPSAATGTVTFFDNGNSLGSASLSGGKVSLSASTLSVGQHSITATYNGDGNYNPSTSGVLTQVVNGLTGTTTTLVSSTNPSVRGQKVTFTATIAPVSGAGTPTGTVKFLDGTTTLGTATLGANETAALTVSNLSVGTHSITAQYSGDSNYNASTSSTLSETVKTKK